MPKMCECMGCVRFRDQLPPSKLTAEAVKSLERANAPRENSRRARIKRGEGKSGGLKAT